MCSGVFCKQDTMTKDILAHSTRFINLPSIAQVSRLNIITYAAAVCRYHSNSKQTHTWTAARWEFDILRISVVSAYESSDYIPYARWVKEAVSRNWKAGLIEAEFTESIVYFSCLFIINATDVSMRSVNRSARQRVGVDNQDALRALL